MKKGSVTSFPREGEGQGQGKVADSQLEDRLFANPEAAIKDFSFDQETAGVFDNMVTRSVPFYTEIQRMIVEMAGDFATPGSSLFDLGCATGTTLAKLDAAIDPQVHFVGVDNSGEMLQKARLKLESCGTQRLYNLVEEDLHDFRGVENASVVVMVLTLQFIRPLYRQKILESIFRGMNPNGCLLLVEKLNFPSSLLNRLFIKHYYDFKVRNGYSEIEISRKREALENVLIPYHFEENREMLTKVGFGQVDEFFRWYNFCGMLAIKT